MILTCPNSPVLIPKFVKLSWPPEMKVRGGIHLRMILFAFLFSCPHSIG